MQRVFSQIRYFAIILALSFQTVFAETPSAEQQHASEIVTSGITYTDITAITNEQNRKDRFLSHIADQHFGLNPNSYATYNPAGSEKKELRSEFILANTAIIDRARANAPNAAPNAGTVAEVRSDIECIALHNYLVEVLMYKRQELADKNSFKNILININTFSYEQLLNNKVPDFIKNKLTNKMQGMIDALNNPSIWDKIETICTKLNTIDPLSYNNLLTSITNVRRLISNAATGGTTPFLNSPDKVTVIIDIKNNIRNLIQLQRSNMTQVLSDAQALQALASEAFTYAMGLAEKRNQIDNKLINIYCLLPTPIPNPITPNIVRMVSQTPWYNPPQVVGSVGAMTNQAQRPNAREIMVGFLTYDGNGSIDGINYIAGNLDYSTMYSVP